MALTVVGAGTRASLLSLRHGGEVAAAISEARRDLTSQVANPEHRVKSCVAFDTSRRKASAILGNRGHHGNETTPPDRRNPDRGTPGRARAVGGCSPHGLNRAGGADPGRGLVRVLPYVTAEEGNQSGPWGWINETYDIS